MIYFVTGTDTDSGKTLISSALLSAVTGSSVGFKPIASGCVMTNDGLRNSDALALMQASSVKLSYEQVNPIAFEPAIAPHIAAVQKGQILTLDSISASLDLNLAKQVDLGLIEGAGGWHLPLGQDQYLSQWVKQQQLPVILVVGMKLGCLNHALLTQQAIIADGLKIAGWVANQVDANMNCFNENLASLQQMMSAPYLGCVPYLAEPTPENAKQYLDLARLA